MQNFTEIEQSATGLWPKMIFNMAAVRHLEFYKKNSYLVSWLSSSSKCAVLYQTSSKLNDFLLRYGDLMIFIGGHVEFSKFGVCHVTSIAMLFCFPVKNFTEIGQFGCWVMAKNDFCRAMLCISAAYAVMRCVSVCHVRELCQNE